MKTGTANHNFCKCSNFAFTVTLVTLLKKLLQSVNRYDSSLWPSDTTVNPNYSKVMARKSKSC